MLVALAVTGCDIDFTEPTTTREPPPTSRPTPARLFASLHFLSAGPDEVYLSADFDPGKSLDGKPRSVADDTLRVGDWALPPRNVGEWGNRNYRHSWPGAAALDSGDLVVQAPILAELDAPAPAIAFRRYRRLGPDTVVVMAGDTLRLESEAPGAADPPEFGSWRLNLSSPGGSLSRYGEGRPPARIDVPTDWLEWLGGDTIHVSLHVSERWLAETGGGDYRVQIQVTSELGWTVLME